MKIRRFFIGEMSFSGIFFYTFHERKRKEFLYWLLCSHNRLRHTWPNRSDHFGSILSLWLWVVIFSARSKTVIEWLIWPLLWTYPWVKYVCSLKRGLSKYRPPPHQTCFQISSRRCNSSSRQSLIRCPCCALCVAPWRGIVGYLIYTRIAINIQTRIYRNAGNDNTRKSSYFFPESRPPMNINSKWSKSRDCVFYFPKGNM